MRRPLRCLPGLFKDVTSFDPLLPPCTAERAPVLTLVCQSAVTSHQTSRSLSERWDKLGVGVRGIRTTLGRMPEQGPARRGPPSNFQFSCSVMSESLRPHGPQHARLPRPSPTPRVYSNSCPWSRWCHLILWSPSSPALNLLVRGIHPPDPLAGLRLKQSIEPRRVLITFQRPQQSTLGARTDPTVLRPRVWARALRKRRIWGFFLPRTLEKGSRRPSPRRGRAGVGGECCRECRLAPGPRATHLPP